MTRFYMYNGKLYIFDEDAVYKAKDVSDFWDGFAIGVFVTVIISIVILLVY